MRKSIIILLENNFIKGGERYEGRKMCIHRNLMIHEVTFGTCANQSGISVSDITETLGILFPAESGTSVTGSGRIFMKKYGICGTLQLNKENI